MKMVVISPVPAPKSFADVAFTTEEHKAAVKVGDISVPMVTAKAAVKNSKGMYRIKPTAAEIAKAPQLPDPSEMTNEELFAELTMYGKAPQKPMARTKVIEFIKSLREKGKSLIVDDEDE